MQVITNLNDLIKNFVDEKISIHHLKGTNTNDPEGDFSSPGRTDTYTFWGDANETVNLGSFSVTNGYTPDTGMGKETYDINDSGVVDNSEAVGGKTLATIESERDVAITNQIDIAILDLLDGVPNSLDTLNELAEALNDDEAFATTVVNSLALKVDSSTYTSSDVKTKYESNIDTNVFTNDEKTKVESFIILDTVDEMINTTGITVGTFITVKDYFTGSNSGVLFFKAITSGVGTANGFTYIDSIGSPTVQFKQNIPSIVSVKKAGAVHGGAVDIGVELQAMIDANEGQTILFDGQFLLDSAITSDKGIKLAGDIGSEIIIGPSFRSGVVFSVTAVDIPNRSIDGFQCEGIEFSGAFTPYLWLSDLSDTPITDPEADYVMGTGALASGISGVSLTSVLSGDGVASVTVNNGGAGWNNHPTYPYLPDTVLLKFVGDGYGAQGYGTIVGGTITSVTITDSGYGYTVAPTVTTQGGYADISLLVDPSVDRRNPGYINPTQLFQTKGTRNSWIRGCTFTDIIGRVVFDQGSLDLDVSDNYFENCGKEDGAFHVLYAQNHLTTPSENISFKNNRGKNLRRSFAMFNPTGGGTLSGNYIDGYREAAVFMNELANSDGGNITIKHNTFKNGVASDIVCHAVEAGGANNVKIHDNTIENCEEYPMVLTGNESLDVYSNTLTNNGSEFEEPYGPFSERFTFNPGTLPTAGRENGIEKRPLMATIGSFGALPMVRPNIHHNTINEDRATYPKSVFRQVKSGTDNISIGGPLKDNILNIPSDVVLLDAEIQDVWSEPFFPRIKDNINHVSESNVVHVKQFAAAETGTYTVDVGFMPTSVRVYAAANNKNVGRFGFGEFSWSDTDNDFTMISSVDAAGGTEFAGLVADEVVQTTTATGTIKFSSELVSWNETGFTINVITAAELTNVRFVCVP